MKTAHLLGAALLAATTVGGVAEAAVTVNVTQDASGVKFDAEGTLVTTGLDVKRNYGTTPYIYPKGAGFALGAGTRGGANSDFYGGFSGPASFGAGGLSQTSAGTGTIFGYDSTQGEHGVFLPLGFVSGGAVAGTATYQGSTLTSLGLKAGSYTFTSANDSVTVNIIDPTAAVPEPATWAMMLLGFGGLGYAMRRRPEAGARVRFA